MINKFEHVWTHFTGRNCESFKIKHLNEENKEQIVELIMEVILTDDPIIEAFGISSDPVSVESLKTLINTYLQQNITFGCFLQQEGKEDVLVAVDLLYVRRYNDPFPEKKVTNGEAYNMLLTFIRTVERYVWHKEFNKSLKYLTSFGVITKRNYLDLDIEHNMLRLRKNIAKTLGVYKVAAVIRKSRQLPPKSGYRVLYEFDAQNMEECGLPLKVLPIKIMGKAYRWPRPEPSVKSENEEETSEAKRQRVE